MVNENCIAMKSILINMEEIPYLFWLLPYNIDDVYTGAYM
jgi:hypothetical protein